MIEMIDRALLYKQRYDDFKEESLNSCDKNPYEKFKNAESYLGWRELCEWFTGLFEILNSTTNRLDTDTYIDNLEFLKDFHDWFTEWKVESVKRRIETLPKDHTAYQSMTCFFIAEASEDCISMIEGMIGLTEYYCRRSIDNKESVYFMPRRISQDLVENGFSRIRLAIGHGRLDHRTTSSAITRVSMVREIKNCDRLNKKRNASGESVTVNNQTDMDEICTEHATNRILKARADRALIFNEKTPFRWIKENGIEILSFNYC